MLDSRYLFFLVHGRWPDADPPKPACRPRTKPIPKKRAKPRRCSPVRDEPYKAWIRTLPCLVCHPKPLTPQPMAGCGRKPRIIPACPCARIAICLRPAAITASDGNGSPHGTAWTTVQ